MSVYGMIAVGLISCVLVLVVKQYRPELGLLVSIAAGCVILLAVLMKFTPVIEQLKSLVYNSGIKKEYLSIMIKSLGICYLTQFASDICNDFGQTSLASKIELCGRVTLAALSMPLMITLIETVSKMVGTS